MPLTTKGKKIMASMRKTYSASDKAKEVFYASQNAGTISGVTRESGSTLRDHKKRIRSGGSY